MTFSDAVTHPKSLASCFPFYQGFDLHNCSSSSSCCGKPSMHPCPYHGDNTNPPLLLLPSLAAKDFQQCQYSFCCSSLCRLRLFLHNRDGRDCIVSLQWLLFISPCQHHKNSFLDSIQSFLRVASEILQDNLTEECNPAYICPTMDFTFFSFPHSHFSNSLKFASCIFLLAGMASCGDYPR